jgi:DNA primase
LWQRETEGRVFDSPERKAALDKSLREKIMLIKDPSIRSHYGQEIKDLRYQLFRPQQAKKTFTPGARSGGQGRWNAPPQGPSPSAKSSMLVTAAGVGATEHLREAVILSALLGCPQLVEEFETGLAAMQCQHYDHARIRDLMLRHLHEDPAALREKIYSALGEQTLENMTSQRHVAVTPCIRTPGNTELTRMTVAEELGKLEAVRGLDAEIADAMEDLSGVADEGLTWRLSEAARNADRAQRSGQEDTAEYDIAENGAHVSRDERSAFDALIGAIRGKGTEEKK